MNRREAIATVVSLPFVGKITNDDVMNFPIVNKSTVVDGIGIYTLCSAYICRIHYCANKKLNISIYKYHSVMVDIYINAIYEPSNYIRIICKNGLFSEIPLKYREFCKNIFKEINKNIKEELIIDNLDNFDKLQN